MKKFTILPLLIAVLLSTITFADSAKEMKRDAQKALKKFHKEVSNSNQLIKKAKAIIVFKDVKEAGFMLGGRYGEGVLIVGDQIKEYISITSATMGMQMGVQKYSLVVLITSNSMLKEILRDDNDWEANIDVNVAVAEWNAKEERDDIDMGSSLTGFLFDSKGAMGSFVMEGTHFTTITPD